MMITTTNSNSNDNEGTAAAASDAKHLGAANGTKSNLLRGVFTSFTALTLLVTLGISFRYVIFDHHDAKNIMMEAAVQVQSSKASKVPKVSKSDSGGGPPPPPPDDCVWKKDLYCRDPYVYFDFGGWPCPASELAPGTQVGQYIESDPLGKFDTFPVNLDTFVNATAFYGTIKGAAFLIVDMSIPGENIILQTVDVNETVTTYSLSNC
jgi:hypothetical protein